MKRIILSIKSEIVSRLVGNMFSFKGQQKRVTKFGRWWDPGFGFHDNVDLGSIATDGPITTTVRFNLWAIMEINPGYSKQVNINGNFGPINIAFESGNYQLDFSHAQFNMIEID